MAVLVFLFIVVPITLAVAVSDPPVSPWELVPGLVIGVAIVIAYFRWWWKREREHRVQDG
jgi:nitrate reductase gamma subunit